MPGHASESRLLGGLDLAATLRAGRAIAERGLLAEADGGIVLIAMAERVSARTASTLAGVLDDGVVVMERDGLALRTPTRIGMVALDEGIDADERPPAALLDRFRLSTRSERNRRSRYRRYRRLPRRYLGGPGDIADSRGSGRGYRGAMFSMPRTRNLLSACRLARLAGRPGHRRLGWSRHGFGR